MPRFAILTHDRPFLHWDFLLEHGPHCRTWRLLQSPDQPTEIFAEALSDHRLIYLEYEGPVSGDRGIVRAWDSGTFEWLVDSQDRVEVRLQGHVLNSVVQLVRADREQWVWNRKKSCADRST